MAADDTDPFAPLGPADGPAARAPGIPAPRSRLSSSSMRRAAPLRSAAPSPVVAPVAPPAPEAPLEAPAHGGLRRRAVLGIAVAAALLASVGGAALLLGTQGEPSTARLAAGPADSRFPAPPVPLGPDSEFVATEVLDDGDLLVTHWVSSSASLDRLTLVVPAGSGVTDDQVEVSDLVVAADDVPVASPEPGDPGWAAVLPGARDLYVHYRLSGVAQRSGSAAGRALATLTSLTLGVDGRPLARTQTFSGGKVLTLACLAQDPRATPTLCGTLVNDTWTLDFAADAVPDTVIAQLDLDREDR